MTIRKDKHSILGVYVDAVDYAVAVDRVVSASRDRRSYAVTALAVHGTMTGVFDPEQRYRLNQYDLVLPDGQPIRWALNWLYRTRLRDRVYGPQLTVRLVERAASEGVPIFLYGSTEEVIGLLVAKLQSRFPAIKIVGAEPSSFSTLTPAERDALLQRIRNSGAQLVFVGLGCPRQEIFVYEARTGLNVPIVAVGAAFPYLAGTLTQPPGWVQKCGLEWLFRLMQEPKRLWTRYLLLNPAYVSLLLLQRLKFDFDTQGVPPTEKYYG